MWLFLAFLTVPLIEIALFIQVGGAIGLWPTLGIVVLSAVIGTWLVRTQGAMAMGQLRSSFSRLDDPSEPLAHGAMILIAGALLADVGKPLEYEKDAQGRVATGRFGEMLRHPFSGVALCYKYGIPPEVMHIVATHSHEGDRVQRASESIRFHHADSVAFDTAICRRRP